MEYTLTAPKGKGLKDNLVAKAVIKAETEAEQRILSDAIVWISNQRRVALAPAKKQPAPTV